MDLGPCGAVNATPLLEIVFSNFYGKTVKRQYLMDSFGGALSS
jgi:hypothetical protein